jgi:aminopeptidase-like protein
LTEEQLKEIKDLAHELFPMFQLLPGEGIEDAIDRVVPVLQDFIYGDD